VDDLGPPTSYLALAEGTPVLTSDGVDIGRVRHVLADADGDIFDGLVVDVRHGGDRFVDAPEVAELYERGVVLALDAAAAERLPEPSANPAVVDAEPDDTAESGLQRKLRRAWDRISGNY
jgi:hypothetical protein